MGKMDEQEARKIIEGYRQVAMEAVVELEKSLYEHRAYDSDETVQWVKLCSENAARTIQAWQDKVRAAAELLGGGPVHRILPLDAVDQVEIL
jgi:hypothetical protein